MSAHSRRAVLTALVVLATATFVLSDVTKNLAGSKRPSAAEGTRNNNNNNNRGASFHLESNSNTQANQSLAEIRGLLTHNSINISINTDNSTVTSQHPTPTSRHRNDEVIIDVTSGNYGDVTRNMTMTQTSQGRVAGQVKGQSTDFDEVIPDITSGDAVGNTTTTMNQNTKSRAMMGKMQASQSTNLDEVINDITSGDAAGNTATTITTTPMTPNSEGRALGEVLEQSTDFDLGLHVFLPLVVVMVVVVMGVTVRSMYRWHVKEGERRVIGDGGGDRGRLYDCDYQHPLAMQDVVAFPM